MTSSTASPIAADTGLPPNVLKYSIPLSKASAIARVVTTAPSGWPFPIGLPIVTMSGTAPRRGERPRGDAHPPEPDLDLVGDRDRPDGTGAVEVAGQPAGRRDDLAGDGRDRLGDRGTGRMRSGGGAGEDALARRRGRRAATSGPSPRWAPRYGSGSGTTWTSSRFPAPPGPANLYGLISTSRWVLPW